MKSYLLPVAAALTLITLTMVALSPNFVTADEYGKSGDDMMMGKHSMGATIESIDHKTGFLKLKSGMGDMIIHYPPPAIKDLNKGDKITVNLSFSKEEGMMKMK